MKNVFDWYLCLRILSLLLNALQEEPTNYMGYWQGEISDIWLSIPETSP